MTLKPEHMEMFQSYGRSFLGAALALYMAGITDPYLYLNALVAAFAPVAIRFFNKNDIAFGKISGESTPEEVAAEVTKAVKKVAKKAPAKKAPAKSTAKKTTSK
jgi:hypothetical protein